MRLFCLMPRVWQKKPGQRVWTSAWTFGNPCSTSGSLRPILCPKGGRLWHASGLLCRSIGHARKTPRVKSASICLLSCVSTYLCSFGAAKTASGKSSLDAFASRLLFLTPTRVRLRPVLPSENPDPGRRPARGVWRLSSSHFQSPAGYWRRL